MNLREACELERDRQRILALPETEEPVIELSYAFAEYFIGALAAAFEFDFEVPEFDWYVSLDTPISRAHKQTVRAKEMNRLRGVLELAMEVGMPYEHCQKIREEIRELDEDAEAERMSE